MSNLPADQVLSGCAVRAEIQREAAIPWQPIETAPKDGTLLLLLVEADMACNCNPVEDEDWSRTVGFNNFDHDGEDEWKVTGWCWSHDHFTEGHGKPVKWMLYPAGEVKP